MKPNEKILHLINLIKSNNGFITSAKVTEAGFQRRILSELVAAKQIYRIERGIYALPEAWEDDMYFLQYRYTKGIFSNGTALYLHKMTDRTPISYTMTFPHGYNTSGVKKRNIRSKYVTSEIYNLGITEILSPSGNPLRVYDIERTLCDIVKGKNALDIQLVNQAMKNYADKKDKNIPKLMRYAEQLRVKSKVIRYMEVLL